MSVMIFKDKATRLPPLENRDSCNLPELFLDIQTIQIYPPNEEMYRFQNEILHFKKGNAYIEMVA